MTTPSGLTSASSNTQVEAAYDDNAAYAELLNTAMCRAFVTACRIILRRMETGATKGSDSLNFNVDLVRQELERAQEWLLEHQGASDNDRPGPSVTKTDFTSFRGPM